MRKVDPKFFVNPQTDILLAGFGGSANTYAHYALLEGTAGINVASHLHVSSQVRHAVRLAKPTLTLVRHPLDAIASLTSRNGLEFSTDGMGWALRDYIDYYKAVVRYRDSFVACSFRDVIEDFPAVIERVNDRFGTAFSVPETGSEASRKIVQDHKWPGWNRMVPVHDAQVLLQHDSLARFRDEAIAVYEEFCNLTGTRIWKDADRPPKSRRPGTPTPA